MNFKPLNINSHGKEVLSFCVQNKSFFIDYEKIDPNKKMVKNLFEHVPNGVCKNQKIIFGVYYSDKLSVLIELIKDRHKKKEWLLSLFIVDKEKRQQGLGKKTIEELELYLISLDVQCLILGVIDNNNNAKKFWKSMNYIQYSQNPIVQQVNGKIGKTFTFYKEF